MRPAAGAGTPPRAPPPELLAQAAELGLAMLGVPEELGGAVSERSSVTSVLATEALAQGDMGLAVAALAPAAVATALSLWGDASQQADLSAGLRRRGGARRGAGDPGADRPVRSAGAEHHGPPRRRRLRPVGDQVAGRAGDPAELLIVAADLEGAGPALFLVESASEGLTRPAPAWASAPPPPGD